MGKYAEIVNGSWSGATLYAESIPHLLHWDLAYFWVLERASHLRPAEWGDQVKAWRYLVALLLTDQLEIEVEPIVEPFLRLTRPYGIEEVSWLKLKHEGKLVGALSPTVLARPLPDYNRGDLRLWEKILPHPEQDKRETLHHFVKLAIQELNQLHQGGLNRSPILPKLVSILDREFPGANDMNSPPAGAIQSIPILKRISWVQEDYDTSVEPIDLLVGSQSNLPVGKVYIPLCERCKASLTYAESAAPIGIQAGAESFILECSKPTCRHSNELSLEQFMIWERDREMVVWDRQDVFPPPDAGFPPTPTITGREVQFEWQAAQLRGERTNRFLRFRFPDNKQVTLRKVSEIFYRKLLVPGELGKFTGLPFQLEWGDAIENIASVRAQPDSIGVKVAYNGLKVRGLPKLINKVYGSLSLKQAHGLGVGVYPNPQIVPEKWKLYRLFLHGQEREQYSLQAAEKGRMKEILPWLAESANGLPEFFSVHSSDNAGVSFYNQPARSSLTSQSQARLHLGVDFGTTNTVIYFLPPGQGDGDFDKLLNNPQEHCVEPPRFEEVIHWLARTNAAFGQPIGDFLPGADYGKKGAARFIIPTVLWEMNDRYLICWDPNHSPPQAAAGNFNLPVNARGNFKLKPEASLWRQTFLHEALLLTLPWVLKRSLDTGAIRTSNLTVYLGFAFPLAFGGPAREEMKGSLAQMRRKLKELTGLEFETNAVSESAACINLLGSPNSTDTFLVADMGGGTIDLALFTASNPDPDQIGSVQFAGEKFLDIFAAKKKDDQLILGDSIRQGNCPYGGDQTAIIVLRQFVGIAFEFLRTMIASYRQVKPDQTIHLVLAGNGWHLAEVFNAGSASYTARQLFSQYYSHLVRSLGDDKLLLSDPLNQLPSSKHLVAVGALKHAMKQSFSQLDPDKFAPSRLPAGRSMAFAPQQVTGTNQSIKQGQEYKIEWFDLIGEPVSFSIHSPEALRGMNISIDFKQMAPLNDSWRSYLVENVFDAGQVENIPYPDEMRLRDQIRSAIPLGHVPVLDKGPLQLIIENHWAEWLKR